MNTERELRAFAWPVEIKPIRQQTAYSCAAASLSYSYSLLELSIRESELLHLVNPQRGDGAEWLDLISNIVEYWFGFSYQRNKTFEDLLNAQLMYEAPILVQWFSQRDPENPGNHVSVIHAINEVEIVLMDPAFKDFFTMSSEDFMKIWKDEDGESSYLILSPGSIMKFPPKRNVCHPKLRDTFPLTSLPSGAAALAHAYHLLGLYSFSGEEIENDFGLEKGEETWFDLILNLKRHGFGAGFHCNRSYDDLLAAKTFYGSPILVFCGFLLDGVCISQPVIIETVNKKGVHIMDPAQGRLYLSRSEFKASWKAGGDEGNFLIFDP